MKKVSSVVWQFFDRLEENKRCVAVLCKLCDSEYKYFGNTTNLRVHLMKKHPIQWELRQSANWDAQKTLDESGLRTDDESNHSAASTKRRTYTTRAHRLQNVRYPLSVKKPRTRSTGEDTMPKIEIQRVDVLENEGDGDGNADEDNEATLNLVRQMHNSDEEWLEEDYSVEMYKPKRKKVSYRKIKREVVTPPRHRPKLFVHSSAEKPDFIIDNSQNDEYTVFGEYIANKLRKFKAPRTRGNIQQLITTILWQAEYGMYDDADSVKRVLMYASQMEPEQSTVTAPEHEIEVHTEDLDSTNKAEEISALESA